MGIKGRQQEDQIIVMVWLIRPDDTYEDQKRIAFIIWVLDDAVFCYTCIYSIRNLFLCQP